MTTGWPHQLEVAISRSAKSPKSWRQRRTRTAVARAATASATAGATRVAPAGTWLASKAPQRPGRTRRGPTAWCARRDTPHRHQHAHRLVLAGGRPRCRDRRGCRVHHRRRRHMVGTGPGAPPHPGGGRLRPCGRGRRGCLPRPDRRAGPGPHNAPGPVDRRPSECCTLGSGCDGGFAQFVAAPADDTHAVHSDRSDEELAAVPCAYSTAENMLQRAMVGAERVLVTGASGGVGLAAVQLAKRRGASVTAMCSATKSAAVAAQGAGRSPRRRHIARCAQDLEDRP